MSLFEKLFPAFFRRNVNFFDVSENCCEDQTAKYILHGYMNRNMTPDDYLDKLTDYTDEHLGINFIGVRSSSE